MNNYECEFGVNGHAWIAGLASVHEEDARQCAIDRAAFGQTVECEACERIYDISEAE